MSSSSFEELSNQLGVKAMKNHKKYLGLPTLVERSKTQMFKFVRDRVWKKLKEGKEKAL